MPLDKFFSTIRKIWSHPWYIDMSTLIASSSITESPYHARDCIVVTKMAYPPTYVQGRHYKDTFSSAYDMVTIYLGARVLDIGPTPEPLKA